MFNFGKDIKKENGLIDISIKFETYCKIKSISEIEHKDFTEVIEELLSGKQITL